MKLYTISYRNIFLFVLSLFVYNYGIFWRSEWNKTVFMMVSHYVTTLKLNQIFKKKTKYRIRINKWGIQLRKELYQHQLTQSNLFSICNHATRGKKIHLHMILNRLDEKTNVFSNLYCRPISYWSRTPYKNVDEYCVECLT